MCGIGGAVGRLSGERGDAARAHDARVVGVVERISAALRHRGPDGSGLWASSGREVVFAHRRLAILDLSEAGAQPMVDGESGCVITFNGEIYNFLELRRELEALGESFRSSSDTEVILKAYKRWGIDAVRRFRGIFALALWDPRSRSVHLVRDQMGIKPLYWTTVRDADTGQEVVLFASEVRALLASGVVPRRLDPAAVASYLFHGFVVGPATILENVHLLPAASILTIAAGRRHRGRQRARAAPVLADALVRRTQHDRGRAARRARRAPSACSSSPTCPWASSCPAASTRARWRRSRARWPPTPCTPSRSASTWPPTTRPATPPRSRKPSGADTRA